MIEGTEGQMAHDTEERIREVLASLECILTAHDSCAELVEFKDNRAVIFCGGPCKACDNRCIEDAVKTEIPGIDVVIQ
jgi:Fe-S cluster biogenesis protein NfuA